ncbi:MAG: T9SS type A sorting domain-containing protein, partial [Sphingobacteriales bacterium]
LGQMGTWGTTAQTLALWNASSAGDANSSVYTSASYPAGTFFTGAATASLGIATGQSIVTGEGDVVPEVTDDYNNAARSITAPTVGAHEYGKNVWTGAVSTNWGTAGNWSANTIPNSSTASVRIPAVVNQPVLNASYTVGDFTVDAGATVTINAGNDLMLKGTLSNGGLILGAGTAVMNGTTAQVIQGTMTINNLTINNATGVSIASFRNNEVNLTGTLNPLSGTLTTNGNLTLAANAAGTARIAEGTGTYITGNVTVEKYLPVSGNKSWNLLGVPHASTVAPTIFASWQSAGFSTAGYGTRIFTDGGDAGNGFDKYSGKDASIYYYNAGDWTVPANTTTTKVSDNGAAWFLYVRGDRTIDPATSTTTSNTVLSTKATLNVGNVTTGVVASDFSLIPNPYASSVDFEAIRSGNGSSLNTFYVWDPILGTEGGFRTVERTGPNTYLQTPATGSASTDNAARFIKSGQAFMIPANMQLNFTESMKTALTSGGTGTTATTDQELAVNLKADDGGTFTLADGVRVRLNSTYVAGVTSEDITKPENLNESLAVLRGTSSLSVERRPMVTSSDTIYLSLRNTSTGTYQFTIEPAAFSNPALSAKLMDNFLNNSTPISLTTPTTVSFQSTNGSSAAENRFKIVIIDNNVLAVDDIQLKASLTGSTVKVDWTAINEHAIADYDVERSTDARHFVKTAAQPATKNDHSDASYSWTDVAPVPGDNFYRIRATGHDGKEQYSTVVRIRYSTQQPDATVTIVPNPAHSETISLQLDGLVAGSYTAQLFNSIGQEVYRGSIKHDGSGSTYSLQIPALAVKGVYILKVTNGTSTIVRQLVSQ